MSHMNHAAEMAAQDPAFPDYDDRGWPLDLVGLVLNVREDVVRLLDLARALRSTNALRAQEIASIANSLQNAALPADRYMSDNSGPGLGMQVIGEAASTREPGFVKPDNDRQVFFYEQDFYVLSNFSAFALQRHDHLFQTSEAAYHWEKFPDYFELQQMILHAPSAHEAFKIAERNKPYRRPDWDDVKVSVMLDILREKAQQNEYVHRKLLATGDRELIEDSWRDPFWGWGPNRDGQNMLGKLWMQVRSELRGVA